MEVMLNGHTYSVTRRARGSRFVHVRGPMEFKRPHHAMFDTESERWVSQDGLAGYESYGPRVRQFYAAATDALEQARG